MINITFNKAILPVLISSTLMLSGCGGSSNNSDTATGGTLTSGIITGFGSVYVNGIKFETDTASYDVDDDVNADQSDLRVGMRVKINGTINADGLTGTADTITYENELEGPVSAIPSAHDPVTGEVILTILGVDVLVNADTTFDNDDNNLSSSTIQVGDLLEVSGYTTSSGITATHIEIQTGGFTANVTEIEIKGEIIGLSGNGFTVNGLNIEFDVSTELEDIPGDTLVDGLYVEVKGTLNAAGDLLSATKIEAEHDGLGEDADDVELEGYISEYNDVTETFIIQGQLVDASGAPDLMPASLVLENDAKVEVEGELIEGVLYADKIKLKGRKIKIHAPVSNINTNLGTFSFSLFGGSDNITVRVNEQTEMEDDIGDNEAFLLSELQLGDFVEVEAFDDGSGVINAVELDRKDIDSIQIEGPVSAYNPSEQTVTLFGQTFDLSYADYEDETDMDITSDVFYGQLAVGSFVELTDETPSDGVIDKAELEEEDDD